MCTVSLFFKENSDFILTSNRDEAPNRVSLAPEVYSDVDAEVIMPKDVLSGGSWIGASSKNRVLCLLNGAFVKHQREAGYRISRGVVVNDLLKVDEIVPSVEHYNLEGVEPFTLVIVDWNSGLRFFELVWDGNQKHFNNLPLEPKLWSSSTLYNQQQKEERQQWFGDFKTKNNFESSAIFDFHHSDGGVNSDYGVVMDRGHVKTTSITQIQKTGVQLKIEYKNIMTSEVVSKIFNCSESVK